MLTVYVDFKSPAAYLALRPTLALAEKHGIDLVWRPFKTAEREVPKMSGKESVGESHRRVRAESRRAIHEKYAAVQGLKLNFPEKPIETACALGALAMLETGQTDFVTAAFKAYWVDHADLNDLEVVRVLLAECETNTNELTTDNLCEAQEAAQTHAEEAGIVDAPGYVIDGEIFVGREHLPWIEEILGARG